MMLDWFQNIKDILGLDAAKRNLLIGLSIMTGAIMILHSDNEKLKEQIASETAIRRAILAEERRICGEQLGLSRASYEEQFTEYVISNNEKVRTLNEQYLKKSEVYLNKIIVINMELNKLKNEINR